MGLGNAAAFAIYPHFQEKCMSTLLAKVRDILETGMPANLVPLAEAIARQPQQVTKEYSKAVADQGLTVESTDLEFANIVTDTKIVAWLKVRFGVVEE